MAEKLDSDAIGGETSSPLQLGEFGCGAITAAGTLCKAPALLDSDRCLTHSEDPKAKEIADAARRQGGLVRAHRNQGNSVEITPRPDLGNAASIRSYMDATLRHLEAGTLSPNRVNSMAYVLNTAIRLGELELSTRVAALEKALELKRRTA